MKSNLFFYLILAVLVVVDAWLLAHPNLLGKIGVMMFKYDMIRTFPRALATVGLTALVCQGIVLGLHLKATKKTTFAVLGAFLVLSIGILINTYFKFSSGTYAMTGAGFKTGAHLTPLILILIFGNGLYETSSRK